MAAEYEVNIKINSKEIENELGNIDRAIAKIGKPKGGGSRRKPGIAGLLPSSEELKAAEQGIVRLTAKTKNIQSIQDKFSERRTRALTRSIALNEKDLRLNRRITAEARARLRLLSQSGAKGFDATRPKGRQLADDINARAKAQDRRAKLANRINEIEAKGLNVAKLRKQLGKATTEQARGRFAGAQKEFRLLQKTIELERSKLQILKEQSKGFLSSPIRGTRTMMGSPAQMKAIRQLEIAEIRADKNAHFAELRLIQKRQKIELDNVDKLLAADLRALDKFDRRLEASDRARQKRLAQEQRAFQGQLRAGVGPESVFGPLRQLGQASMIAGADEAKLLAGRFRAPSSPLTARPVTRASADQAAKQVEQEVRHRTALEKRATDQAAAYRRRVDKQVFRAKLDLDRIEYKQKIDDIVKYTNREIREGNRAGREFDKELKRRSKKREAGLKRGSKRLENVALGAGFPLLFGGGPGSVIGGGLGGLTGSFGAQIGLSAAGQQIDQLIGKAIELGQALNPAAFNLERVTEAAGFAGTETQNLLEKIERYGDKAKAAELATELLRARIGDDGVKALEAFGKQAVVLGNNLSVIFTTVLANIAKAVQPLLQSLSERLGKTAAVRRFQAQDPSTLTGLDKLAFDILDPQLGTKGKSPFKLFDRDKPIQFFGTTPFQQLRNRAKKLGLPEDVDLRKFATERATKAAPGFEMPVLDRIEFEASQVELPKDRSARIKRENMIAASERRIQNLQAEAERTKEISAIRERIAAAEEAGDKQLVERLRGEEKAAEIVRKKARLLSRIPKDLDEQQRLAEELAISDTIRAEQLANQEATQRRIAKVIRDEQNEDLRNQADILKKNFALQKEELEKAQKLAKGLTDIVRDGFVDGIKAATDETRTLSDALANMLDRLADKFLNLAANMAFYGNQQANLQQGQGLFGTLLGSVAGLFNPFSSLMAPGGRYEGQSVTSFISQGGPPPLPPFPGKELGGAVGAGRPYMVGERGPELFVPGAQGNIVPNNAMGGSNIVVNVDASGSSVEGDSDQAAQLGKMLGAAVQAELVKQKRPGGLLAR